MKNLTLRIKENILIPNPPSELYRRISRENTFANPKYESNKKQGYSNWKISSTIETYRSLSDGIIAPRGYLPELLELLEEFGLNYEIEDFSAVNPTDYPSLNDVTLRPYQFRAVIKAMQIEQGVIVSPTGSGKSLIGLEIIRQRKQKALILVHRSDLARQWIDVIKGRMGIEAGLIGEGLWNADKEITVAMVQSLSSKEDQTKTLSQYFGLIIYDEVHHVPAGTFSSVLGLLSAKYRYGLSATMKRRDGLEQMIYRNVGSVIASVSKQEVEKLGATVPATVFVVNTNFYPGIVNSWNEYLDAITKNPERNSFVLDLIDLKTPTLILADRIEHASQISEMLTERGIEHVLAHGQLSKKDRADAMDKLKTGKLTVGTTGLLGEGLDVAHWSTLIMTSPISSEIKLMQAVGRIVRPSPGKEKAIVYDLRDNCGFAGSSFKSRFEIYKKNKIWVNFDNNTAADRKNNQAASMKNE